jgi:hypothetical protein
MEADAVNDTIEPWYWSLRYKGPEKENVKKLGGGLEKEKTERNGRALTNGH